MRLQSLLQHHQFFAHPFRDQDAKLEQSVDQWFVPPVFLDSLLGYQFQKKGTHTPRSTVVLGRPGTGKTTLRTMLEKRLAENSPRSLVLRYIDLFPSNPRPTLAEHVEEILRLGTLELMGYWQRHVKSYQSLGVTQKAELAGLISHYYDVLPPELKHIYLTQLSPIGASLVAAKHFGERKALSAYNAAVSVIRGERIEPMSWNVDSGETASANPVLRLQRFWSLAKAMNVDSLWVLVDDIDESQTRTRGDQIFNCVAELLLSPRLMMFCDNTAQQVLCFKVFLSRPDYVAQHMRDAGFRPDKIETHSIEWHEAELKTAFIRRLAHYSNSKVLNFDQLCDTTAQGTHDRLIAECGARPRTLFRMAYEIMFEFDRRSTGNAALIDNECVHAGIQKGRETVIG